MKEILVAPVPRSAIVLGKIAGSSTVAVFNGVAVMTIATLIGAIPAAQLSVGGIMLAVLFMLLISTVFVAIGLSIATQFNSTEGFQLIMNFLIMPIFFLSGAFFPISTAPVWMRIIAHVDPLMYGVEGMRWSLLGISSVPGGISLAVLFGLGTILVLISARLFSRMDV